MGGFPWKLDDGPNVQITSLENFRKGKITPVKMKDAQAIPCVQTNKYHFIVSVNLPEKWNRTNTNGVDGMPGLMQKYKWSVPTP